jgi:hypothetical protein
VAVSIRFQSRFVELLRTRGLARSTGGASYQRAIAIER